MNIDDARTAPSSKQDIFDRLPPHWRDRLKHYEACQITRSARPRWNTVLVEILQTLTFLLCGMRGGVVLGRVFLLFIGHCSVLWGG